MNQLQKVQRAKDIQNLINFYKVSDIFQPSTKAVFISNLETKNEYKEYIASEKELVM